MSREQPKTRANPVEWVAPIVRCSPGRPRRSRSNLGFWLEGQSMNHAVMPIHCFIVRLVSAPLFAGSYSTADAPALRSRRHSTPITALITSGSPKNVRKFQLARENVRRSLIALTVADRGPPSSKASSPTASPGPNSARCTPCAMTSAVPSRMRKNRPAPSPSITTSAPARNDISFPASQILFSCFCGRSRNNSEACTAAMISLAIRLTFQVRTIISKGEEVFAEAVAAGEGDLEGRIDRTRS